jgi:acetylglutamate synthase
MSNGDIELLGCKHIMGKYDAVSILTTTIIVGPKSKFFYTDKYAVLL